MSAEFELLRWPRLRGSRKTAKAARQIINDGMPDIPPHQVHPKQLMAVLGKNATGYHGEIQIGERRDDTIYDFYIDFTNARLSDLAKRMMRSGMSTGQREMLERYISPHFEESLGYHGLTFVYAYGVCATMLAKLEVSTFTTWPVPEDEMFLNDKQMEHIGPFMRALGGVAENHQPYLTDFVQGLAVGGFESRVGREVRADEFLLASSGVGLACLQLQHFNNQNAAEVALFDYPSSDTSSS